MAYLKALNAGCQFPVASFAEFVETPSAPATKSVLKIRGIYWDEQKKDLLKSEVSREMDLSCADVIDSARQIGVDLANEIYRQLSA